MGKKTAESIDFWTLEEFNQAMTYYNTHDDKLKFCFIYFFTQELDAASYLHSLQTILI